MYGNLLLHEPAHARGHIQGPLAQAPESQLAAARHPGHRAAVVVECLKAVARVPLGIAAAARRQEYRLARRIGVSEDSPQQAAAQTPAGEFRYHGNEVNGDELAVFVVRVQHELIPTGGKTKTCEETVKG
ncbi:hypothetical protein Vretimale_13211 [Volvox reticuliferus]|uniref:Uncharacterized protein n=1 Tax=Volvox reticuliferus TaxID=1737510 RepID=A0A8J4GLD0_9CHLO|nr:hypothetical protein Vretimale_13211 [Volvox reticuliferus]